MVVIVCAILAIVCFLVALLGASIGVDLVTLGLVFLAGAFLAAHLPGRVRR
jgi:hypothetical protein